MRIFLSTLAVMIFTFGMALEHPVSVYGIALTRPLLVAIAGVLLLIVLASFVWMLRRRFKEDEVPPRGPSSSSGTSEADRSNELKELGIMEIRPKERKEASLPEAEPPPDDAEREAPSAPTQPDGSQAPESDASLAHPAVKKPDSGNADAVESDDEEASPEEAPPSDQEQAPVPPSDASSQETRSSPKVSRRSVSEDASPPAPPETRAEQPAQISPAIAGVLAPYLEALRTIVDARTVCLLKQEELALEYEVEALVSTADNVLQEGIFSTATPLLTASMAQRAVTVQRIGERALPSECLGYYRGPATTIRQVMLAPVDHAYEPASFFLLADTVEEGGFNAERPRVLMTQFAKLLSTILDEGGLDSLRQQSDVRPRSEIIAEEIKKAQDEDHSLALALIYLNRAEALADEGERSVSAAEKSLEQYLRTKTPEGRVERFGELTYGVFHPADVAAVETWAMQLESDLEKKDGRLEGGISIGIAMLGPRHKTPDALRADATEALREAYETGTCTILE